MASDERFPPPLPVWSAPLVPVAIAMTVGIVADRFGEIPIPASLTLAGTCFLVWFLVTLTSRPAYAGLGIVYLCASIAGLAAAYHHWQCYHLDANDVQHYASFDGRPVRLRGALQSAPIKQPVRRDPMRSFPTNATTRFMVAAAQVQDLDTYAWRDVTGLAQITVIGSTDDVTVGDEVELLGRLTLPDEAMNPGGFDYASFLRDQGVTATLTVFTPNEVIETRRGWPTSLFGWLAVVRGWGQRTLARDLGGQSGVAAALLLGEGADMSGDEWEQYRRTGVLHVLAISGQHFVVLAGFLWLVSSTIGFRRRNAAPLIAILLIGYALMTGGRPPVMRAAWVVVAYCGGIWLQRPIAHANTFALAWIGVAVTNPTDVFNAGCQLSFLAVAALIWGVGRWAREEADPLKQVIAGATPWYGAATIWCWRSLLGGYAINFAVWLVVSPLVAAHFHVVAPIALLIGPPLCVLTSVALLTGFAFLLLSWCWPLAWLFAGLTRLSLFGCELLVSLGQEIPGAYHYVADVPPWWLWSFYVPLLVGMTLPIVWRHGRWALAIAAAWLFLGVLLQMLPHRPGEFRCTFVAVGHGGCTVIETPNGRVIVYDAGATGGPEVTRRHIAPFLWSRGIRRIDDLILSHADLDHFNGVPQLTERFSIGRIVTTPTFAQRDLAGMQKTLSSLEKNGIPMEIVHAGKTWENDGVRFTVLHPPALGPPGKENVRSLVLHLTYDDWTLLLTGDLEEEGLKQVLARPAPSIDVMMAPHHGSDKSNGPELAKWAKPKLVVSCQTTPISERQSVKMYERMGAKFLGTWPHGAVTIRPADADAPVQTHRTKLRLRP